MYVTGCHRRSCPITSAGRIPRLSVTAGTASVSRNAATLAMTSALIAGVSGPGPNEYEKLDAEGMRGRIDPVCYNWRLISNIRTCAFDGGDLGWPGRGVDKFAVRKWPCQRGRRQRRERHRDKRVFNPDAIREHTHERNIDACRSE